MDYSDGIQYAIDVTKGNIEVCKDVQLVCQRFLDMMANRHWEYEFVSDYVDHFISFAVVIAFVTRWVETPGDASLR
jgi:phage terminase large subunit-like protein